VVVVEDVVDGTVVVVVGLIVVVVPDIVVVVVVLPPEHEVHIAFIQTRESVQEPQPHLKEHSPVGSLYLGQ